MLYKDAANRKSNQKNLGTIRSSNLCTRTPNEFENGHIENAVNIDFKAADFIENISALNKNKTLLIYCRSGNRSGKAAKIMDSLGFTKIYDLEGGFMNW